MIDTEDIKQWVLAVNHNNQVDHSIDRAVTLNCLRCKGFDAYQVTECIADGCCLHPFRNNGLLLDYGIKV